MLQTIPVDRIVNRPDARAVDPAAVQGLVDSIATVGLINPIRVRAEGDHWEVIAGVHRVEAHKHLGLVEINAEVVEDDDLHAELAMIDENLCRSELSPSDRARQTARRKAIYLELHPETAQHVAGAHRSNAAQGNASANLAAAFSDDTAKATGQSERTVQRDAERGEKVIDEVLNLIRGTKLDTGTYLDKLKKLPGSEQYVVAKRDLASLRDQERNRARRNPAKLADRPLNDVAVLENQVAALINAWNKASPEAREEFADRVGLIESNTATTAAAKAGESQTPSPQGSPAEPLQEMQQLPAEGANTQPQGGSGNAGADALAQSESMGGDDVAAPGSAITATAEAVPHSSPDASATSTNSEPGDGQVGAMPSTPVAAEAEGASPTVSSAALNALALRPYCQHVDDLTKCGGQGRRHCYMCLKAHADEVGEAA